MLHIMHTCHIYHTILFYVYYVYCISCISCKYWLFRSYSACVIFYILYTLCLHTTCYLCGIITVVISNMPLLLRQEEDQVHSAPDEDSEGQAAGGPAGGLLA